MNQHDFDYYETRALSSNWAKDVRELTAEIKRLQSANAALLEACKLAVIEMKTTDRIIENQAEVEGKLGSYSPFFAEEIRVLEAALAMAEDEKMRLLDAPRLPELEG